MKLTKAETNLHDECLALLNLERRLTEDECRFVFTHFHPGASNNIGRVGQFFTPPDQAQEVAVFAAGGRGRCVDLCAGIGVLAWHVWQWERHSGGITEMVCVELDPALVDIGRRLLPEATWVRGDAFDRTLLESVGHFHKGVSNPPYGKVSSVRCDWTTFRGSAHLMMAEVLLRRCRQGGIIVLPDADHSNPHIADRTRDGKLLRYRPGYETSGEYDRWQEALPEALITPCSVDPFTGFKATDIRAAICNVDVRSQPNPYFAGHAAEFRLAA